jgi:hypothetical protein
MGRRLSAFRFWRNRQTGKLPRRMAFVRGCAFAIVLCSAALPLSCDGDEPKVAPDQRDATRVVAAVSDVVYQCSSVEAGYTDRVEVRQVERDVDTLVRAWDRLRPDSPFRTATGRTTLRRQASVAVRRLEEGCVPKEATRLRKAMEE